MIWLIALGVWLLMVFLFGALVIVAGVDEFIREQEGQNDQG